MVATIISSPYLRSIWRKEKNKKQKQLNILHFVWANKDYGEETLFYNQFPIVIVDVNLTGTEKSKVPAVMIIILLDKWEGSSPSRTVLKSECYSMSN